jgi:hypothetical protein
MLGLEFRKKKKKRKTKQALRGGHDTRSFSAESPPRRKHGNYRPSGFRRVPSVQQHGDVMNLRRAGSMRTWGRKKQKGNKLRVGTYRARENTG